MKRPYRISRNQMSLNLFWICMRYQPIFSSHQTPIDCIGTCVVPLCWTHRPECESACEYRDDKVKGSVCSGRMYGNRLITSANAVHIRGPQRADDNVCPVLSRWCWNSYIFNQLNVGDQVSLSQKPKQSISRRHVGLLLISEFLQLLKRQLAVTVLQVWLNPSSVRW